MFLRVFISSAYSIRSTTDTVSCTRCLMLMRRAAAREEQDKILAPCPRVILALAFDQGVLQAHPAPLAPRACSHWAGPPAPIVFVPCVEAGPAPYYWGEYGWVVDTLAKNLSALVVFAEHRFFGETFPRGDTTAGWYPDSDHLGLLTEAQVLEDYTALATALRTNLSAWDSPLISVGGSLAGEMTTWWRIRYPFMVDMGLAGSAPILGFPGLTDPFGWNRVVTQAFRSVGGDECVSNIREGYWQTAGMTPAQVNAAFNPCTPATQACHAEQVADLVMNWAATATEAAYPQTPATSSVLVICGQMAGSANGVEAYQRALAPMQPGQCMNITFYDCEQEEGQRAGVPRWRKELASRGIGLSVTAAAAEEQDYCYCCQHTDGGCHDGWSFESCTTEIHPIMANNVSDFFPPDPPGGYNETGRLQGCRFLYGGNLTIDHWAMPRSFGQLDLARMATSASRIIFSSGSYDPWSAQSLNVSLSPSLPFILIEGGAHHSDLGGPMNPVPTANDSPAVVAAREFEIATLNKWVAEFHAERAESKARLAAAGLSHLSGRPI